MCKEHVERALASVGIGGYFLHVEHVNPDGNIKHVKGPYKRPFNPYANFRLYFFKASSEFHLKPPEGAEKPDEEFI